MSAMSLPRPPHMSGRPLIGNALEFLSRPKAVIKRGLQQHGRVFALRLGFKQVVVGIGPEYHKIFFEETDKLLSIREAYPFLEGLFGERLYFLAEHEEYKAQRAVILSGFHSKRMKVFAKAIMQETSEFMDRLGWRGEVDLTPTLGPVVMAGSTRAFLGDEFRDNLGVLFFESYRELMDGVDYVLPYWLPLPRFIRSRKARKRIQDMLVPMIADRRVNPRGLDDFFQILVEGLHADGRPYSDSTIANFLMILIMAGHEATTAHLAWTLIDLLQNPKAMRSIMEEQNAIWGDGYELAPEYFLKNLSQLDRALKETERIHPVTRILARVAVAPLDFGGYCVPKGSVVMVCPSLAHRLPEIFPDPDYYDLERFSPERQEDAKPYSLIGFGGGPHHCAGIGFARLHMKLTLTMLLRRYEFTLLDEPKSARGAGTDWPASPCRVRYVRRDRLPQ